MRIGYPCINLGLPCRPSRTFRLASLSEERFYATVDGNLRCLEEIVRWNVRHRLLFLRITSDLIPFASHPENAFPWQRELAQELGKIGTLIRQQRMRISMHPDQFVLLNTPRPEVLRSSIAELAYHARLLDLLGLDRTAKIQLHVGGAYGDKKRALKQFVQEANRLPAEIRGRLVVENDERLYTVADCVQVHSATKIPVLFDSFHHALHPDGLSTGEALAAAAETWGREDGLPLVDYSSPLPGGRTGQHAASLDELDFQRFLDESRPHDFDLMLEVKDKEASALRALALAGGDPRLVPAVQ